MEMHQYLHRFYVNRGTRGLLRTVTSIGLDYIAEVESEHQFKNVSMKYSSSLFCGSLRSAYESDYRLQYSQAMRHFYLVHIDRFTGCADKSPSANIICVQYTSWTTQSRIRPQHCHIPREVNDGCIADENAR